MLFLTSKQVVQFGWTICFIKAYAEPRGVTIVFYRFSRSGVFMTGQKRSDVNEILRSNFNVTLNQTELFGYNVCETPFNKCINALLHLFAIYLI